MHAFVDTPALAVARRIAGAFGWPESYRGGWHAQPEATSYVVAVSTFGVHLVTPSMKVRIGNLDGNRPLASLVFFPPDGPPALTPDDIGVLKSADAATDGMLTFGARNADDANLLAWLAS